MMPSPTAPRRVLRSSQLIFVFFLLLLTASGFTACRDNAEHNNTNTAARPDATPIASSVTVDPLSHPAFDGERAFEHVRKMVDFGPRPAGSAELARTRGYLMGELQAAGLKVTTDEFAQKTPVGERQMVNVTAELAGESPQVIIVSSHYDTKPFKDFRFVGANDAGSSTGALIEIARSVAASGRKPRFTYHFVFFDGEEAFCRGWDECGKAGAPDNTYGSRRYVAQLAARGETKNVRAMILLDMIGYTNLAIPRESLSTPWLVDIIWQTARDLGYSAQFPNTKEQVEDDHIAFLQAEIPVADIIQLSGYPFWHTSGDTLDKISSRSLQVVGETVVASLPRIEQHLSR